MKKSFKSMLSEKRIATKVGSVVLAVALLSCVDRSVLPVSADNTGIVTNGLVAQFDGKHNTKAGQDKNSTTWYDLAGNNNITGIPNDGTNYFSDEGLVLDTKQYTLSDTINNTVNGAEFTVELALGDLVSKGRSFNTFINCPNDNFSFFRRCSNDEMEFKFQANGGSSRPKVSHGLNSFQDSTVAITYKKGGYVTIYVDGTQMAQVECPNSEMNANGLFLGHEADDKNYQTTIRAFRVYNRELSASEIKTNVKVDNPNVVFAPEMVSVQQPATNIIGDIGFTEYAVTAEQLNRLATASVKPASLIFYLDSSLKATDAEGKNAFATVEEIMTKLDEKIMPVFYIRSEAAATALSGYLNDTKLMDAFVISDTPALVKSVRQKCSTVRGVVDFSAQYKGKTVTTSDLSKMRATATANLAKIVVLPDTAAKSENVMYLIDRQMAVWAVSTKSLTDMVDVYTLLLSGAHGIISDNTALLSDTANKLSANTMTRPPVNIGHRGMQYNGIPENTLEAAIAAYNNGATSIELDIYLTTDGQLVINHNDTTGSLYNKDLKIEQHTLAELKALKFKDYAVTYRMPTLDEYFKEFKGKDVTFTIEIKSYNAEIIPVLINLINKYDNYDQCVVNSFSIDQLKRINQQFSEMTTGLFGSGYASDPLQTIKSALTQVQPLNAIWSPWYGSYNDPAYFRAATMRGMLTSPWTLNTASEIYDFILCGSYSITTDHCNIVGALAKSLELNVKDEQKIQIGTTVNLKAKAVTYNNLTKNVTDKTAFTILSGGDKVTLQDGKLICKDKEGTVQLVASYVASIGDNSYTLYTQPVTLTLTKEAVPPVDDGEDDDISSGDVSSQPDNSDNTSSGTNGSVSSSGQATTSNSQGTGNTSDNLVQTGVMYSLIIVMIAVIACAAFIITAKRKESYTEDND